MCSSKWQKKLRVTNPKVQSVHLGSKSSFLFLSAELFVSRSQAFIYLGPAIFPQVKVPLLGALPSSFFPPMYQEFQTFLQNGVRSVESDHMINLSPPNGVGRLQRSWARRVYYNNKNFKLLSKVTLHWLVSNLWIHTWCWLRVLQCFSEECHCSHNIVA